MLICIPEALTKQEVAEFRAEMDCVVAFSACPQDMLPINGRDCVIHDAHFQVLD